MTEYIKMIVIALVSGILAPLPTSAEAHFSVLCGSMNLTADEKELGFYFGIFSLTFAVVIFFCLRKIYFKCFGALFRKAANANDKTYKSVAVNILLSLIPGLALFIPMGEGVILFDYFDKFLTLNGLYLTAIACLISALILIIAIWYSKQTPGKLRRVCGRKGAVRMAVYQLVSYVVPGFSHIASAGTNMLICDVHPKVIMREVYLYLAPTMFFVNLAKIIRLLVQDTIVDVVTVLIGVVVFALCSGIVVKLVAKFNAKKILTFFAVYSAVFAVGIFAYTLFM